MPDGDYRHITTLSVRHHCDKHQPDYLRYTVPTAGLRQRERAIANEDYSIESGG